MAEGNYEGKSIDDPEVRALFDRDDVLASSWYRARLEAYRDREAAYIAASVDRLRRYLAESAEAGSVAARRARAELARTEERMVVLGQAGYIDMIVGSIGLDPALQGRRAWRIRRRAHRRHRRALHAPRRTPRVRGGAMRDVYRSPTRPSSRGTASSPTPARARA